WARTHVPFLATELVARWGLAPDRVEGQLRRLVRRGELVEGSFRQGVAQSEYCHPDVLRALRRRSLAALRRETEPVGTEVLARFLPAWHGIGSEAGSIDRLPDCVVALQGLALPASVIEGGVLRPPGAGHRPAVLA